MVNTSRINASIGLLVISILLIWIALPATVGAAVLSGGSLQLSDPRPNQTSSYTFLASGFTSSIIRCIELNLTVSADGSGGVPSDLTTTGSTFDSSSLLSGSWGVDNTTNGTLRLTNATGETPSATGNIVWAGVSNGDTADTTYYGTFTTYTNADCTNPVDTTVVTFIFTDGSLVELVIEPTLTFLVAGVASGLPVNGATTSQTTTASSINFGNNVTATTNGISAHDLEVSTNAPGGYSVYIRHSGGLSNGSHTINTHTGTNGSPLAFLAAGNEAWGYTTEELARFNPNLWAGLTTTNELVAENTNATAGTEENRVGHQVGIEATTPAGTYQTTVIYTVTSTY